MTKRARVVLTVIVVELLLAGVWMYLLHLGASKPDRVAPYFRETIGSTLGALMGALLGLGLVLFILAGRQEDR